MPNADTPTKFAIQDVFYILLRDPVSMDLIAYLEDIKTSGLENTIEMVYPTGGRGIIYSSLYSAMSKANPFKCWKFLKLN